MKKDFNFILLACAAAVILGIFFTLPSKLRPRDKLFSEDNPLNTMIDESEVSVNGLE